MQNLGEADAANTAFSSSLSLWKACPEAWVSWGAFCDAMFDATPSQHTPQQLQQQPPPQPQRHWLQSAVRCYLAGIRLGSQAARNLIPRLLYLLSFENATGAASYKTHLVSYS